MTLGYPALKPSCHLKRLEFPAVYDTVSDNLYELSEDAFEFLQALDGSQSREALSSHAEFIDACLNIGVAELLPEPRLQARCAAQNEIPSLRYLLASVTERCNLACRHCYLGPARPRDLAVDDFSAIVRDFEEIGGLRLLITGGEPLMHPAFSSLMEVLDAPMVRVILLSNGTLLDEPTIASLPVDEVQISIDGFESSHERLRGRGAYSKAIEAAHKVRAHEIDLSVATMITAFNLPELPEFAAFVHDVLGARSLTFDIPSPAGRLTIRDELIPDFRLTNDVIDLQYGSDTHEPSSGATCGAHLAFIAPDGVLTKCGFYSDEWSGGLAIGRLRSAWKSLPRIPLEHLGCECDFLDECRGGCRYRAEVYNAGDRCAPDPMKCAYYGFGTKPNG